METTVFYKELEGINKEIIDFVSVNYQSMTFEELTQKPSPEKWSIGECLQHLVCYGDFYLAAMEKSLNKHQNSSSPKDNFKPGYFGNKFAEMLRYKEQGMKKMKAPNIKVLSFDVVQPDVLNVFLKQQEQHLLVLEKTKQIDLEKVKVPIALIELIKTKIGDTLRFTIYHNQRHFIQSQKVFGEIKAK